MPKNDSRIPTWLVEFLDNDSAEGSLFPDLLNKSEPSELDEDNDIEVEINDLADEDNERDINVEGFAIQSDMFSKSCK